MTIQRLAFWSPLAAVALAVAAASTPASGKRGPSTGAASGSSTGASTVRPASAEIAPDPAVLERGRMLVTVGGCNDCHTPWKFDPEIGAPLPDMSRMLSGHPAGAPDPEARPGKFDTAVIGPTFTSFALPFGTVYTANLTPDLDTGLGSWTEKMFVDALKTGKHMGGNGRGILPPMPWTMVGSLEEPDLKAIYAYLRTIPAIRNPVPGHKVPEPVINAITESNRKLVERMRAEKAKKGAH